MYKSQLSVVISTHNSQDLLEDCLRSVKGLTYEIIIVDNESTDNTVKIAKKYTNIIHHQKNNPLVLNKSKNYGFTKATNQWILNLDPDERVGKKLAHEISKVINQDPQTANFAGYQMPRKNIIFGSWIRHGLWYPDYQTRLFKSGLGQFAAVHNHEKLEVKGPLGTLEHHLLHYNYTSVSQYIDKFNHLYTQNEADELIKSGKKVAWYDSIRMPLSDFLTNFFAREAYKDGLHGLNLSLLQSFYTFTVFLKIWEKQKFRPYNHHNFLQQCRAEFVSKLQEFQYWYQQKQGSDVIIKTGIKNAIMRLVGK